MLEIVLNTIRKHKLIPSGSKLVVGVSGGTDSLALLHVLYTLRDELKCQLHVATLDHGLRGDASAEDARFVVDICEKWGIPVTSEKVDVNALAQGSRFGVEAVAREARYNFFINVLRKESANIVAVAHHADDQAETVLMRIIRGTGTAGLRAMSVSARVPTDHSVPLVRPLLEVTRQQIEAYCAENDLQPRHDATNDDTEYTRNNIRHKVMPLLRNINPQVAHVVNQLANIAALEQSYLESELQKVIRENVIEDDEGRRLIPRAIFRQLHPALQRCYMTWAAKILILDVEYQQVENAVEVALSERLGAVAQFHSGIQMRIDYDVLSVEWEGAEPNLTQFLKLRADEVEISIPGTHQIHHWHFDADLSPSPNDNARLAIPEGAKVILRTRRTGERFAPLGLNGHTQKLSEWMVDHKIPRVIRDYIPLLVVDGQIAAILYGDQWTISHHFVVKTDEKRIVYVKKY